MFIYQCLVRVLTMTYTISVHYQCRLSRRRKKKLRSTTGIKLGRSLGAAARLGPSLKYSTLDSNTFGTLYISHTYFY